MAEHKRDDGIYETLHRREISEEKMNRRQWLESMSDEKLACWRYGACTERDSFYYGQGYKDGRKEMVDELMGKLSEEVDGDIEDEWYAGRDCGIDRAMELIESMDGEGKQP